MKHSIGRRSYAKGSSSETQWKQKTGKLSFIESLNENVPDHLREGFARRIVHLFPERKDEAARLIFRRFNKVLFGNKLPRDLMIVWSNRLLVTAGQCRLMYVEDKRTVIIQLSSSVCDSVERLRDVLVHEMCHAAVWIINGKQEGHGPLWKQWAAWVNRRLPDLPTIKRSHSYKVARRYLFVCTDCSTRRHAKSLDTLQSACHVCGGTYQLRGRYRCGAMLPERRPCRVSKSGTVDPFAIFVWSRYRDASMQSRPGPELRRRLKNPGARVRQPSH